MECVGLIQNLDHCEAAGGGNDCAADACVQARTRVSRARRSGYTHFANSRSRTAAIAARRNTDR